MKEATTFWTSSSPNVKTTIIIFPAIAARLSFEMRAVFLCVRNY